MGDLSSEKRCSDVFLVAALEKSNRLEAASLIRGLQSRSWPCEDISIHVRCSEIVILRIMDYSTSFRVSNDLLNLLRNLNEDCRQKKTDWRAEKPLSLSS